MIAAVGGVSDANFVDYTRVGILAFGLGSSLYKPGMTARKWPFAPKRRSTRTSEVDGLAAPKRFAKAGGGESVSQSPLMYKLFFISARGHLRSLLPLIGSSVRPLRLKPLCRLAKELVRKSSRGPLHR